MLHLVLSFLKMFLHERFLQNHLTYTSYKRVMQNAGDRELVCGKMVVIVGECRCVLENGV